MPRIERWVRERELASNARCAAWAQQEIRREHRRVAGNAWWPLTVFLAIIVAATAVIWFRTPGRLGALVAGMVAAFGVSAMALMIVEAARTQNRLMGIEAEKATASEVRRLRRRGWKLINHIRTDRADIDHVAIGPGGVFAIETKSSTFPWGPSHERLTPACTQARGAARDVSNRLYQWQRNAAVEPVLALIGPLEDGFTLPASLNGVTVVRGYSLREWLRDRTDTLGPNDISSAWGVLEQRVRERDGGVQAREGKTVRGLPASMADLALGGLVGLSVVVALGLSLMIPPHGVPTLVLSMLVASVATMVFRRFRRWPRVRAISLPIVVAGAGFATLLVVLFLATTVA